MTPERMQQIEALFHDACNLAPSERTAFLDAACAGDKALRREVELLLASDGQASMRATLDLARLVRHCIKEDPPFLDSCLEIVVCHRRCCMARTRARLSGRPACRSGVICPGLSAPQGWPLAARAGCPYSGALGRLDHAGAHGWHVGGPSLPRLRGLDSGVSAEREGRVRPWGCRVGSAEGAGEARSA